MRWIVRIIALIVFISSILWWFKEGGFEPWIGILTGLSGLIGAFMNNDTLAKVFKQRSGKNSTNQQADGDINNTGSFNKKKVEGNEFVQNNNGSGPNYQSAGGMFFFNEAPKEHAQVIVNNLPYNKLGGLFMGRARAIQELSKFLITDKITVVLHGLGGIGKTRLAVEYAWYSKANFLTTLFLRADSQSALQAGLAALANSSVLNLPERDEVKQEVKRDAVLRWFQANPNWLLILDNADTPDSSQAVEQLLPQLSNGSVLVTSRLTQWSRQVHLMPVDVLSHEDATNFLLARAAARQEEPLIDREEAKALAHELGGLALALEQAGAYIDTRRISIREYRERWAKNEILVREWFNEQLMKYPRSVAVTWQTSFDQLGTNAKDLLNQLSWLSNEAVPSSSVKDIAIHVEESLADLSCFSLITYAPDNTAFSIHKLVQDIARQHLEESNKNDVSNSVLKWMDAKFMEDIDDVQTWSIREALIPHALRIIELMQEFSSSHNISHMLAQIGHMLIAKAQPNEGEQLIRRAIKFDESNGESNEASKAFALNELGLFLLDTHRELEAVDIFYELVKIDEKYYGEESLKASYGYTNLGLALSRVDNLDKSEYFLKKSLVIQKNSSVIKKFKIATTLNGLAGTFLHKAKLESGSLRIEFLKEAESFAREAVEIAKEYYGENHTKYASYINSVAVILRATDDNSHLFEVEFLYKKALNIFENTYDLSHPIIGRLYGNLAYVMQITARPNEAENYYKKAVNISNKYYRRTGHKHPSLMNIYDNYSNFLLTKGKNNSEIASIINSLETNSNSH